MRAAARSQRVSSALFSAQTSSLTMTSDLRPGAILEAALWIDGRETPEMRARFERETTAALHERAKAAGVLVSDIAFEEKDPLDERVPPVPKHISGPRVKLLVGTAVVLSYLPEVKAPGSFVHDLDAVDLARLRILTRDAHNKRNPGVVLTDEQCDAIIEQIGPQSAAKVVKAAVDSGTLH